MRKRRDFTGYYALLNFDNTFLEFRFHTVKGRKIKAENALGPYKTLQGAELIAREIILDHINELKCSLDDIQDSASNICNNCKKWFPPDSDCSCEG